MCDFVKKYPLLAPYKDSILATAQTIAPFTWQEWQGEGRPPLWQSHLGGVPYLPLDDEYPYTNRGYPFALFAQINFAEMPPIPDFPTEGILQIFVDGMDDLAIVVREGSDKPFYRYYPNVITDDSALQQTFPEVPLYQDRKNPPCVMHFEKAQTQYMTNGDMHYEDVIVDKNGNRLGCSGEAYNQYSDLSWEFENYIGGYLQTCQYDPRHRIVFDDVPDDPEEVRFEQSRLLLQLTGEFPFFDYYHLLVSFFIHPDDLRQRDFSGMFADASCD